MRKALYILGILDDSDASWLATAGKARSITTGAVIIQQGVPVDSVFILIDGQLQVHSGSVEIAKLWRAKLWVRFRSSIRGLPLPASRPR